MLKLFLVGSCKKKTSAEGIKPSFGSVRVPQKQPRSLTGVQKGKCLKSSLTKIVPILYLFFMYFFSYFFPIFLYFYSILWGYF